MSNQRNHFIYRQSIQLNFPIRLRSFLLHFLEKHIQEALQNVLSQQQKFHFHLILRSHFTDQQQMVSLNIDPKNLSSEELFHLIERNVSTLSLEAPISSFDVLVSAQKIRWKAKTIAKTRPLPQPLSAMQTAIA